jgi:hypothetical protein
MVSAGADSSLRAALPGLVAQLPRRDAEEPGSRSGGQTEIQSVVGAGGSRAKDPPICTGPRRPLAHSPASQIRLFCRVPATT